MPPRTTNPTTSRKRVSPDDQPIVAQRRAQAAELFGVGQDHVRVVAFQLEFLRKRTMLVDIDIRGISLFSVRATQAELGFSNKSKRKDVITGGTKPLIPMDIIDARLTRAELARRWTIQHSMNQEIPGVGFFRAIPYTALKKWREGWQEYVCDDQAWVESVVTKLDEYRTDYIPRIFRPVAEEAWTSLMARTKLKPGQAMEVGDQKFIRRSDFVEYVIDSAAARLPDEATIRAKCTFGYKVAVLATESELVHDMLITEKLRVQETELREQQRQAQARTQIMQTEAWEREQIARQQVEAMRVASLEAARKQLSETQLPIAGFIDQLNQRLREPVQNAIDKIRHHGYVHGKISSSIAEMMDVYRTLNAGIEQPTLEAMLASLQKSLGPVGEGRKAGEKRDTDSVLNDLQSLSEYLGQSAAELMASSDNPFTLLEI